MPENQKRQTELYEWRLSAVERAVEILAEGHADLAGSVRELVTTIKVVGAGIGILLSILGIVVSYHH